MQKTLKKLIFLTLALASGLSAQTNSSLQMKFWDALEQANLKEVDKCLLMGADVNELKDGQPPLTTVINALSKDKEEACAKVKQMNLNLWYSAGAIPGFIAILGACCHAFFNGRHLDPISASADLSLALAGMASIRYSNYTFLQCCSPRNWPYFSRKRFETKVAIIKLLLDNPNIKVAIKNNEGKSSFDVMNQHTDELINKTSWEKYSYKGYNTIIMTMRELQSTLKNKETQALTATSDVAQKVEGAV